MINGYNYSTITIKDTEATQLAIKGQNTAVVVLSFVNGECVIDTADYAVGDYLIQIFKGDEIIKTETLEIKQNLKYAPQGYDPRTQAEKTLQAIKAYLAGTASQQQKKIQVGDKSIQYSSFDQLIKWKNYYQLEVRKQQGKPTNLRLQKLYYRGV